MPSKLVKSIGDLVPDDRNANKGTERGNAMIEHSLRRYGADRSILIDKNGKIIAGNKTVENAGLIGLEEVVVVPTDGSKLVAVQRTDLDLDADPRARELALLDNRTAEVNLDWDAEVLASLKEEGLDTSAMFSDAEMDAMIRQAEEDTDAEAPEDFASYDESIETDHKCPKCGYEWSGQAK